MRNHKPNILIPPNTILVITGPTGIGKTALSKAIAAELPVEIISADSRQIYRFMDIGTAKPSLELLREIPHHFIDILNPDEPYSAGEFGNIARQTIAKIFEREKLPLVTGGSGLYIRALLEGFFKGDFKDLKLRKQLQKRLENEGIEKLFAELQTIDPLFAGKTHPNNIKRVIRGLEVYYSAGKPLSEIQQATPDPAPFKWIKIGLTMERQQLYQRINQRVEKMFEAGLIAEVQQILDMGYSPKLNSLDSVGYKEVVSYLNKKVDLFTCKERVKQNTRRYAKRQFTWFRAEKDIHWMDVSAAVDIVSFLEDVLIKNDG